MIYFYTEKFVIDEEDYSENSDKAHNIDESSVFSDSRKSSYEAEGVDEIKAFDGDYLYAFNDKSKKNSEINLTDFVEKGEKDEYNKLKYATKASLEGIKENSCKDKGCKSKRLNTSIKEKKEKRK